MEILSFGKINETQIRQITSAKGNWIHDSQGNKYFDSMSGLWCVPLGYSQDTIKERINEQLQKLPFYHNFFHTQTDVSFELTQRLEKYFPDNKRVYYSCSGSAANETALKIVFRYYEKKLKPQKKGVIYFQHSYHGTNYAASQICDQSMSRFTSVALSFPSWRVAVNPQNQKETLTHLETVLKERSAEAAAIIVEPVIGAGGVIPFSQMFFKELRSLSLKYDVKVIVDEVVTGFGKLGTLFAKEKFDITADIFTAGKALTNGYMPLAATFVSDALLEETVKWFNHGYTFSAHPAGSAACLATLDILEKNLVEVDFSYLHSRLDEIQHPQLLGVRKVEGMGALIFEEGTSCTTMENESWTHGIVTRSGSGQPNVLCFCLPMFTTKSEVDHFINSLKTILDNKKEF